MKNVLLSALNKLKQNQDIKEMFSSLEDFSYHFTKWNDKIYFQFMEKDNNNNVIRKAEYFDTAENIEKIINELQEEEI